MEKITSKIIKTILLIIAFAFILELFLDFSVALYNWDDDVMFITALTIGAIVDTTVFMLIISYFLAGIWQTKKKNNKKLKDNEITKK